MDLATLTAITPELNAALVGRRLGKVFQLSRQMIAIDLRLPESRYLLISIEPGDPRIYLTKRRLRDLERASSNPTPFSLQLKSKLSGHSVERVEQVAGERVLVVELSGLDELEQQRVVSSLAMQLTGSSSNLLLLDGDRRIVATARQTRGEGQQIGDIYRPPASRSSNVEAAAIALSDSEGISERLDAEDKKRSDEKEFQSLSRAARNKVTQEITRRTKLLRKLDGDLQDHGEPERWKRLGDVLLSNVSTAQRDGAIVRAIDYFDERAPEIEIEVEENESITEAAERYFKRYAKARNAREEIERRKITLRAELKDLESRLRELDDAITDRDEEKLRAITGVKKKAASSDKPRKRVEKLPGVRSFVSSDGIEILVGKKAKDNDFLTFRIAKSLDTWMHAADYPGSHVVVRNPNRKEIPHTTLLEAAQLAAFYSQGKAQPKAAVHYTQKKFVNKPKGAAPGLVSLASFKTLLVEPKVGAGLVMSDR